MRNGKQQHGFSSAALLADVRCLDCGELYEAGMAECHPGAGYVGETQVRVAGAVRRKNKEGYTPGPDVAVAIFIKTVADAAKQLSDVRNRALLEQRDKLAGMLERCASALEYYTPNDLARGYETRQEAERVLREVADD